MRRFLGLLIAGLVAVQVQCGCSSFPLGRPRFPTAKELADHFESFPIGTPLEGIRHAAPGLFPHDPHVVSARQRVDYWLVCNASDISICGLYRLYPPDVLITTARDDDLVAEFSVRESFAYDCPNGAVEVLLSADGRFKGYYAYSSRGYSRDTKGRLRAEREYYRQVLQRLVHEAGARQARQGDGGDAWQQNLPHLPLKLP